MTETELQEERRLQEKARNDDNMVVHKFLAGAMAGCAAVFACYPLDLVRTRLTTELEGQYFHRVMVDIQRSSTTVLY